MRNLQKYNAVAGSRDISIIDAPSDFSIENIRLIVNETQKVVICSSMQKDNIVSVSNGVVTYTDSLPAIADGDKFTIECDYGQEEFVSLEQEVKAGKFSIANAIRLKGGSANNTHSLETLAADISTIPDPSGSEENPVVVQMASSSAVAAIAKHYSADTPCAIAFVWLSGDKDEYTVELPSCDKLVLSDGTIQDNFASGSVTISPITGDLWKYAVCMFSTTNNEQNVSATYASGKPTSLYEFAAINMQILTINGFKDTNAHISTSNVSVSDVGIECFRKFGFKIIPFKDIKKISGNSCFGDCISLESVYLPSLTTISSNYCFSNCQSLESVSLPSLTTMSGSNCFSYCNSLESVSLPSLTTMSGSNIFGRDLKLIKIEIKQGTDFSLNFSSWNPTEALLTDSTSLVDEGESFASNREKLLYNIRTYMCAKLKDMTGLTAPTFTFGADLKAAISGDAETLAAFTNKNFNVA